MITVGADLNQRDAKGRSISELARYYEHYELAEFLDSQIPSQETVK